MLLTYLPTCCFNLRFLLNIFFVNSRRFYLNRCCELKQRFLHVWHGSDQTIIDNAIIDEWHGRLRACMRTKGGQFERYYCDNIQPYDKRHFGFLSNVTLCLFRLFFWKLPQFHTSKFHKVVRQHTEGMVGNIIMGFVENLPGFPAVKKF